MTIQIKFILIFTLISNSFSRSPPTGHLISELRNPLVGYRDHHVTDRFWSGDPYPAQR